METVNIDILGRRIAKRNDEWNKNLSESLKRGKLIKCNGCGIDFYCQRYRYTNQKYINKYGLPKYCSRTCSIKYRPKGLNKGKKIPAASLAKLGDKNPMRIYGIKPEHLKKLQDGARRYQESIRVSKEHKRIVKKILDYKRKSMIKGQFLPREWEDLKEKYHFICPSCGKKEDEMKWNKLTVDHIIPLSRGGTNTIENIQPLCISCNCRKKANTIKYEII